MSTINIKQMVSSTFFELANALDTGTFGKKVKVGVTNRGSEHGVENIVSASEYAVNNFSGVEVTMLGDSNSSSIKTIVSDCDADMHKMMETMLKSGELDACVTMHYPFPIGVTTIGKVISPANGRSIFIASTTGTSDTDRNIAMFKNAIYGIIAAKSNGIKEPSLGILNIDGARTVERALKELDANGYKIKFGKSQRADGGVVLRGNDLITGAVDVVVCDSLTGNIIIKMFSSFNSGGTYEALGYGYGPGIGFGHYIPVFIVSRASGENVVAGAIEYAAKCVNGGLKEITLREEALVKKAGFDKIIESLKPKSAPLKTEKKTVEKEVVTEEISGVEVMELDSAVELLAEKSIYAESGMGCTGPIILVSKPNKEKAVSVLKEGNFIS